MLKTIRHQKHSKWEWEWFWIFILMCLLRKKGPRSHALFPFFIHAFINFHYSCLLFAFTNCNILLIGFPCDIAWHLEGEASLLLVRLVLVGLSSFSTRSMMNSLLKKQKIRREESRERILVDSTCFLTLNRLKIISKWKICETNRI